MCIQDETATGDRVPASALIDANCDVEDFEDEGYKDEEDHGERKNSTASEEDWFPEDPFADSAIFSAPDYITSMRVMHPPQPHETIDPAILSNVPVIGMGCVYICAYLLQGHVHIRWYLYNSVIYMPNV
jgi:hypothetical protein